MSKKAEQFPSFPQALLLLLALFLLEYVLGAAFFDVRRLLDLSPAERYVFTVLTANAIAFTALMHLKKQSYANLFHRSRSSIGATLLLLLPPILLLIPALTLLLQEIMHFLIRLFPLSRADQQAFEGTFNGNVPAMFAVCILAPVLEEMLFRGIILRAFLLQYSPVKAIILSALLFGLAHLNIYQFVVASLIGLLAGWLYERTHSLIPCIALHTFYNTCITVFGPSITRDSVQVSTETPALYWTLAALAALLGSRMLLGILHPAVQTVRE